MNSHIVPTWNPKEVINIPKIDKKTGYSYTQEWYCSEMITKRDKKGNREHNVVKLDVNKMESIKLILPLGQKLFETGHIYNISYVINYAGVQKTMDEYKKEHENDADDEEEE